MELQPPPPSWGIATRSWIKKTFPERQVHLRTDGKVAFFRVPALFQILILFFLFGTSIWIGITTYSYVEHHKIVAGKDDLISNANNAYESLLGEVAGYQSKFNSITMDLEHNHALMLSLVERNASLQKNLRSVSNELEDTEEDRQKIGIAREALRSKVTKFEEEMLALSSRNFALKDNLNTAEGDLHTALSERNQARFEGTRLRRHVTDLENRLKQLQVSHENSAQRLTKQTINQIQVIENVIDLAGLDLKKLKVPMTSKMLGQGGPFIPTGLNERIPGGKLKDSLTNLESHLDRLNNLRNVIEHLPLTAPVEVFTITSRFGKRRDPINGRWSAHYGVDFGGMLRQSVYATAPGRVTYAGWKSKYGRYVEIDHGSGMKTRYGHLHKIFVKRGERIKFRKKIGLLGNSGRSTGPHLHYETLFNGKYLNPMKLLKAGKYVYQEQ